MHGEGAEGGGVLAEDAVYQPVEDGEGGSVVRLV